jgi:hypothetical protein
MRGVDGAYNNAPTMNLLNLEDDNTQNNTNNADPVVDSGTPVVFDSIFTNNTGLSFSNKNELFFSIFKFNSSFNFFYLDFQSFLEVLESKGSDDPDKVSLTLHYYHYYYYIVEEFKTKKKLKE